MHSRRDVSTSSKPGLQRPSQCSRRARASFFVEQDYEGFHHQPPQPPRCNGMGRGVHSVLRGGVEQRRFAHTVSPLGALPLSLSDVGRKQSASRRRTRYRPRNTWMDHVVSRVRRSRLWSCFSSFSHLHLFIFRAVDNIVSSIFPVIRVFAHCCFLSVC